MIESLLKYPQYTFIPFVCRTAICITTNNVTVKFNAFFT